MRDSPGSELTPVLVFAVKAPAASVGEARSLAQGGGGRGLSRWGCVRDPSPERGPPNPTVKQSRQTDLACGPAGLSPALGGAGVRAKRPRSGVSRGARAAPLPAVCTDDGQSPGPNQRRRRLSGGTAVSTALPS